MAKIEGGIIAPSLNLNKDPIDAAWEKETTDVVNELQHQVKNLVIEPEEKVALIYADTDNIATNIQNYTPIFAEGENTGLFVAFYNYTGPLPTLPIREGITFGPYTPNPVDVTIYQYRRSSTRPNNAGTVIYNTTTGAWTSTGGSQPWQKEVPTQDNIPTWVCFAIIEKSDGIGNITKTWSNPVLLYARERASGIVWHTVRLPSGSPPSLPSATDYNFTTGAFTGLTTNWQQTPPEIKIGEGNNTINDLYWQCNFLAELHPGASTATVTFYSPQSYVPFGTNIQSDNYDGNIGVSPGTQGWAIKRDTGFAEFGGAAIRDTLTIGQIPSGAVNSNISIGSNGALSGAGGGTVSASGIGAIGTGGAAADVNNNSTTINGGKITTGSISANKISATNLAAISADLGTITAGTIDANNVTLNNLNADKITTGSLTATNVNFGVIMQVAHGSYTSSNSNVVSITATNDSSFNTFLVAIANVSIATGDPDESPSGNNPSTGANTLILSGTGVYLNVGAALTNSRSNKQESKTLKSGNLTKGATYTVTGSITGNYSFSGNGNIVIFEVKL